MPDDRTSFTRLRHRFWNSASPHREYLVHDEDGGIEKRSDAEPEPHRHPRREELDLPVDEGLEASEADDVVEALTSAPELAKEQRQIKEALVPQFQRRAGLRFRTCGAGGVSHLHGL